MPTVIDTSTFASATAAFNGRRVDRCQDGTLVVAQTSTSANTELWYSKDNGATWTHTGTGTDVAGATNVSMFVTLDDTIALVWKQSGTGGSRTSGYVYMAWGTPNAGRTAWTWGAATVIATNANFDYPDVVVCRRPGSSPTTWDAFVVLSYQVSTTNMATYSRYAIASDGTIGARVNDGLPDSVGGDTPGSLGGPYAVGAHTYPSIDFDHTGDGKTVAGGTPHVYVGWSTGVGASSQTTAYIRKAVYSAGLWTWNAASAFTFSPTFIQWHQLIFDGVRPVMALSEAVNGFSSVLLFERDAADTTSTTTVLVPSSSDVTQRLFDGSLAYDASRNLHLLWKDGSGSDGTRKLNYRKWTRSGASLGPIITFDTTGNDTPHISAKRGYSGSSIEWVWTDGTASPYSVTYERIDLPSGSTHQMIL